MDDKNPESIPIKNLRTEDGAHELAIWEKHAALPSAVEGGPTIGANEHIPSCHSQSLSPFRFLRLAIRHMDLLG